MSVNTEIDWDENKPLDSILLDCRLKIETDELSLKLISLIEIPEYRT